MKKILSLSLATGIVLVTGVVAFADSFSSPAEIYAKLTNTTVEQAYETKRNAQKTFGQLAEEAGVLEQFREENLQIKKQILTDKVKQGLLTQEQADEVIETLENTNCTTPGNNRIGQKHSIGFGKNVNKAKSGLGLGKGNQNRQGNGGKNIYKFSNRNVSE